MRAVRKMPTAARALNSVRRADGGSRVANRHRASLKPELNEKASCFPSGWKACTSKSRADHHVFWVAGLEVVYSPLRQLDRILTSWWYISRFRLAVTRQVVKYRPHRRLSLATIPAATWGHLVN